MRSPANTVGSIAVIAGGGSPNADLTVKVVKKLKL